MRNYSITLLLGAAVLLLSSGCADNNSSGSQVNATLNTTIIEDFSANLSQAAYTDLASQTSTLYDQVLALQTDGATDEELTACRTTWRSARQSWERSEAFLFGPVSTRKIDPSIDTWPVNFNDLESQLKSENEFTDSYIENLEDALKGFHPIEYLIFGENGDKAATDITTRELEYLIALSKNLKSLTSDLEESWDPSASDNYHVVFTTAGKGSTVYATQRDAFEELVNAMIGICDEVANGKIDEVFVAKDATLEESPFAKNSITDFTNNITGVQNVYLGKFDADGKGLEDLVRSYNLQLDADIKSKLTIAIDALGKVTDPFGTAITSQPTQVQNAINAINDLKDELETNLLPFVKLHTK
ncbi:MAG TPA: imelysin family protein [Cyclobacteriaceae bacterium]